MFIKNQFKLCNVAINCYTSHKALSAYQGRLCKTNACCNQSTKAEVEEECNAIAFYSNL